jgi:hypothetical protein
MERRGKIGRAIGWMVFGTLFMLPVAAKAAPPAVENRVFKVFVDEKPAGEYRMTIRQEGDTETVSAQANVRVSYLIVTYVYTYSGSEIWKRGRLARLDSNTVDDKKKFSVTAWADGDSLRVRANGQERITSGSVWTTTYWRLPAANLRNQAVPLIDADTGKDIPGRLTFVGMENVPVAGQVMQCGHWRVTGGVQVDLWYDQNERLVREEAVDDGHKTRLDLVHVGR